MSPALAKRMNEDVNKALQMPDVIEKLEASGAETAAARPRKWRSSCTPNWPSGPR
jgi:hypothetical protein